MLAWYIVPYRRGPNQVQPVALFTPAQEQDALTATLEAAGYKVQSAVVLADKEFESYKEAAAKNGGRLNFVDGRNQPIGDIKSEAALIVYEYIRARRYCAMRDYIRVNAEDSYWDEVELLGGVALVRVDAPAETIALIDSDPEFFKLPTKAANLPLDVSTKEGDAIIAKLKELGYSQEELQQQLPDVKQATLATVLKIAAQRRVKPNYDKVSNTIVYNGDIEYVKPLDNGVHPIDDLFSKAAR
jgi:hypothetical protein